MTVIDILVKYQQALSDGLMVTFEMCLIIWTVGLFLGAILGSLAAKWRLTIGLPVRSIAFIFSGMPVLVFLFWLHYPLQSLLGIVVDPFITAVATLTILNIFAVSEVVRIVLRDFPAQYLVAAKVCGISPFQTLLYIQLPIVLRQTIPALLMIQVNMLQCTLFASLISVNEIFRVAQQINSQVYKPVEIYTALGLLFLAICLPMNGLALLLRNKFTRDFSER
jgi:His/Glu/Gln/Arg/opine family amino acid ABC transporter permease subunit